MMLMLLAPGFSAAFKLGMCLIYIKILVLSNGAVIVLTVANAVPWIASYPYTFFSLG